MCCWGLLKFCCPVKRSPESRAHQIIASCHFTQRGSEGRRVLELSTKFRDILRILQEGLYYGLSSYKDNYGKQAIKHNESPTDIGILVHKSPACSLVRKDQSRPSIINFVEWTSVSKSGGFTPYNMVKTFAKNR